MQFHHNGYVTGDPLIKEAAGVGIDRSEDLPEVMDVLIVGEGPAGMTTAAQLSVFSQLEVRLIERREHELQVGQADGIQARSVETFQAFGFANRVIDEAYHLREMAFWKPDPENPKNIVRAALAPDDPHGVSEFPHLIINQARIMQYFGEFMRNQPSRMKPNYGIEYVSHERDDSQEYPLLVNLRYTFGEKAGEEFSVRTKYLVGADGARSQIRRDIGATRVGQQAAHAWGVVDSIVETDFPDWRTKCAIQSHDGGSILHIPREGGAMSRMYVDLGETAADDDGKVRQTPLDEIVRHANEILHPYTVEVKDVAWWSVYEVGHRVTDRFDDVPVEEAGNKMPRVFILGDACHTHSAKAGQGMNVSMQDAFNLGWKLAHALLGTAPLEILSTYTGERQVIAQNLIDFDMEWSSMMARKPEEFENPSDLEDFYVRTAEFPAGFMTEYETSMVCGDTKHQELAAGFPVGKRFKSAWATRRCDGVRLQLGHLAEADGRWRIYVFADGAHPTEHSAVDDLAAWLKDDEASPLVGGELGGRPRHEWFDVKVIYQQSHEEFEVFDAPEVFRPRYGDFGIMQWENVFASALGSADRERQEMNPVALSRDIYDARELSRDGVIVVVRPDQYVAQVLPLDATDELSEFFKGVLSES